MALNAVKAALSRTFFLNQPRLTRKSAKRNRCINGTPFIGREKVGEIDATKVDQVLYAHFKVGVLSSESFLLQIICHCLSNAHDFTLISQKKNIRYFVDKESQIQKMGKTLLYDLCLLYTSDAADE